MVSLPGTRDHLPPVWSAQLPSRQNWLTLGLGLLLWAATLAGKGQTVAGVPGAPDPGGTTGFPAAMPQAVGIAGYEAMVKAGQLAEAERGLRAYVERKPGSADGLVLLGYVLYMEGKAVDSLAEYTQAAKLRKPTARDLANVAMDYILLRDYVDADKWLTMAVDWEPGEYLYRYYLGRTKNAENLFSEAVSTFNEALKLRPGDAAAEYNLGLAYVGLGDDARAAEAYRQAITWLETAGKADPQPYLDLGILLLKTNDAVQAAGDLEKAARMDDRNPRAHEELGVAYRNLGRLPEAQRELERAVALAGDVPSLHFELGRVYQKEGMEDAAKREFARWSALGAGHSTDTVQVPDPMKREQVR